MERGYVEEKNYVIEYRSADGAAERFPQFAAELVRLKVDLIVTRETQAALAARDATTTIPIVIASSGDPVGVGLVASFTSRA
jgi:putative tryptophan/tyrosine transport system substrate-binding protein